jgi:alternate signal-mediated exported protein
MNTFVKGAVAAGVATVLLLGGAGTFALWNGSATVNAGAVNAGNLSVTTTGTAAWKNSTGGAVNINTLKWVPGDTYTYTNEITVVASGDTIKAALSLDPASITATTAAADVALKAALIRGGIVFTTGTVTGTPGTVTPNLTTGVVELVGPGTYIIPVSLAVTFPADGTAPVVYDNSAQNGSVGLAALGFKVEQHL